MATSNAVQMLERDLRGIFGTRLQSLVIYGERARAGHHHDPHGHGHDHPPTTTLAIVESMTHDDLRTAAARVGAWHDAGLATPLMIATREFERSLDAFPLEFGAIVADHVVVSGTPPFERASVAAADIRRACEVQARSHLLHLREGFLEAAGNSHALAVLIEESAAPLAALLASVARLEGRTDHDAPAAARHAERVLQLPPGTIGDVVKLAGAHEIAGADAERLFPAYLAAVERLVGYVDGWAGR